MKKTLLSVLIVISLLSTALSLKAQDYQTAIGAKFGGYENGISIKYFTQKDISLEGVLGFRSHGIVLTGLYEKNQEAFGVSDLKLYYGIGAHLGSINGEYQTYSGGNQNFNSNTLLLGADAVLGLEYRIPNAPLAISLDLNPRLELATGPFFDLAPAVGLKYIF
ncbi:hypothetical protein [uncultured Mucilaginibacter sp.]|uniref:hypothetical protein n=1 Tax=uncultured Mucilaginibacter sp. TaxID=797541 RepID=UPI0025E28A3E|nr:hypothetical protein [uncultured Mucilaginibacter sp.]